MPVPAHCRPERPIQVLFLCPGNADRSLMAEAILNTMGAGRFAAFSAGWQPAAQPNPLVKEILERHHLGTSTLRSKSWREFATVTAPVLDFVITVADQPAPRASPMWRGHPVITHWTIPDPGGLARPRQAYFRTFHQLQHRIAIFIDLPRRRSGQVKQLRDLGRDTDATML
jgi:protein-tyrosine-phosphatase